MVAGGYVLCQWIALITKICCPKQPVWQFQSVTFILPVMQIHLLFTYYYLLFTDSNLIKCAKVWGNVLFLWVVSDWGKRACYVSVDISCAVLAGARWRPSHTTTDTIHAIMFFLSTATIFLRNSFKLSSFFILSSSLMACQV